MMLGGVIVIGVKDYIKLSIALKELSKLLMILIDFLAFGFEMKIFIDAEGRIFDDVHSELAHVAFLCDFKAVVANELVMDLEFEDFFLFLALHFSIYNDPA